MDYEAATLAKALRGYCCKNWCALQAVVDCSIIAVIHVAVKKSICNIAVPAAQVTRQRTGGRIGEPPLLVVPKERRRQDGGGWRGSSDIRGGTTDPHCSACHRQVVLQQSVRFINYSGLQLPCWATSCGHGFVCSTAELCWREEQMESTPMFTTSAALLLPTAYGR